MKKIIAVILTLILVTGLFSACSGNGESNASNAQSGEKINIVTTIFPIYDWVKNIIGNDENAQVEFLLDNGADLHNYQPTADDMIKVSNCDMFIYIGGESDKWVEDALKNAVNKNMVVINLLEVIGNNAKEEEIKEGMQSEEETEEGEEAEYDEHIWLSLKNAVLCVDEISSKLASIGREGNSYLTNADVYTKKLSGLESEYDSAINGAKIKTLVFGDRFPFRYLTEEYKLDYYAAFSGCSAESEASFETVSFLAKKVDEFNLKYVMTIESSDGKIAKTIIENTAKKNAEILVLDSMQSIVDEDVKNGASYLTVMQNNLEVLKKALN